MRRPGVGQRPRHDLLGAGPRRLPFRQHRLHPRPLQPFLRSAEVAGDDREAERLGKAREVGFRRPCERAKHQEVALVVEEFRGHRGQPAAMQEIHQEGLQRILAVMAEDHRLAALLAGDPIEVAAPKPRAKRAIGAPLRDGAHDHRIGVAPLDPMRDAVAGQKVRQDLGGKTRLRLIQIAGEEIDGQQPTPFQVEEDCEERVGILAAGEADQPAGAGPHHPVDGKRLADLAHQPLPQLSERDAFRRIAEEGMGVVGRIGSCGGIDLHSGLLPEMPPSR